MNNFIKISLVAFASLLLVWFGLAIFIDHKTELAEKEFQEKQVLFGKYESLKHAWSEKGQKRALKKFKTLLRLYRVKPDIRKRRNQKIFTFTLEKRNADSVLNKILNSDLAMTQLRVKKLDDQHLEVTVGVAI